MKTVNTKFGTVTYPNTVTSANGVVEAKLWEKEEKCRVYFKVYWNKTRPTDCGFYDVVNNKSFMSSNPVAIARAIESELSLTK